MSPSLFAYGTLEIPEVMRAVCGRVFPAAPAILRNHARFLLRGELYPGVVRERSCEVTGILYEEVDGASLALLDRFEGELFRREAVRVETAKQPAIDAFAYVVPAEKKSLLSSLPWNRESFISTHLEDFLAQCRAFRGAEARGIAREIHRRGARPEREEVE